jgi:hypothetical protein
MASTTAQRSLYHYAHKDDAKMCLELLRHFSFNNEQIGTAIGFATLSVAKNSERVLRAALRPSAPPAPEDTPLEMPQPVRLGLPQWAC